MGRSVRLALRLALVGAGAVGLCVGLAVVATDPHPETLPGRAGRWLTAGVARAPTATPAPTGAAEPGGPLFSDLWFDDSGFAIVQEFDEPTAGVPTLAQLGQALGRRGRRGIDALEAKLAALPRHDPGSANASARLHWLIGGLLMYEGDFAGADARFLAAQRADPAAPAWFLSNLEALRGVANLRRGEVENCVDCCNEASCIFPLAPEAFHRQESGSRAAIGHFTRYLEKRPEDLGARWLLNVAAMTLGEYPRGVPERFRVPLGRFAAAEGSRAGHWPNVASRVGLNARGGMMSGGCVVDDFNGDGRLDAFFTTTEPLRGASLFVNRGDGTFEDRSEAAGLAEQVASINACQADYDNDGDLDLLLMRGGWESRRRLSLLRNRGDGTFEDVTLAAGLGSPIQTQAAGWADYDADGLVDLYVAGEYNADNPHPRNRGRLYHNKGDGTFEDVAEAAGVLNERAGKGVAWGDFDDDGRPDLYISNLKGPNRLYRNNGDGTFTDIAESAGVTAPTDGFACWAWDYDNDGRLDIWASGYSATLGQVIADQLGQPASGERPRLYRNLGGGKFADVTAAAGLDRVLVPMGSNFGDLDGDGWLDMYLGTGRPQYSFLVPNVLFRNVAGERFDDVTAATGTGHLQKGHGVAFADWDRDGDADLFVEAGGATPGDRAHNLLFQNPGHGNRWLSVRLVGTTTNRAALGARLRVDVVDADGRPHSFHRTISSGSSFGGNPLACTVGLGEATAIRRLEITWPTSRTVQRFEDVPLDGSFEVIEGADALRPVNAPAIALP